MMHPTKVIHVITRCDRGGSAVNTIRTALGHNQGRFAPMVVMGNPGKWAVQGGMDATQSNCQRLDEAGITWQVLNSFTRELNPPKDLMVLWQLTRLFREERPTIVHTHTSKAGVLGRMAAFLTRVPVVVHTPHGHVFYGHFGSGLSRLFLYIERILAKRTTRIIGLTEAERMDHLERGVGEDKKFAVIPSGIDLEDFRQWVGVRGHRPPGFDMPQDAIVIGSVGWLTKVKGHRTLIEAIARLKPRFPLVHLVMVGGGDLLGELAALATQFGIENSVTFLGERQDIPECLAGMDIFVLPSLNEGMGRALIEAMAAGRPVIASRVGGIPAVVRHRDTGMLVPPGDVRALEGAVSEFLIRPIWAKEVGGKATEAIGSRFSSKEMVRAIEVVYEEALREVE